MRIKLTTTEHFLKQEHQNRLYSDVSRLFVISYFFPTGENLIFVFLFLPTTVSMPEDLEVWASHSYSASSSNVALWMRRMCWRPCAIISYFFPFLISVPSFNQVICGESRKKMINSDRRTGFRFSWTNKRKSAFLTLASSLETSHSNLALSFSRTSTSWRGLENSTRAAVHAKRDSHSYFNRSF